MSDEKADKITVSYDELNTRKVEQRLKEQDALARNRVYASMDESMVAPTDGRAANRLGTLWRNSIFALALFGLIGGLLAWGCGALLEFKGDTAQDTARRMEQLNRLLAQAGAAPGAADARDPARAANRDSARRVVADFVANGRENNKHFELAVIRADADFRRKSIDAIAAQQAVNAARVKQLEKQIAAASTAPARETPAERKTRDDRITQGRAELNEVRNNLAELTKQLNKEIAEGRKENPDFAVMTDPALGPAAAQAKLAAGQKEREGQMAEILSDERTRALVRNLLAYGVRGLILGCLLAIAVPLTENNLPSTIVNGSVGAALGLIGGVAAALVTDRIRAFAAGTAPDSWQQFLATVAVWGALGVFLTLAPGVVMRNHKKLTIGLMGGLIGGLIGGVLFEPIKNATEEPRLAELVAMVTIGLLAGLATGLIEDAAKTGWVKVVQGLIAGKQFILYRNPTFIGAGPDCQIYLFKDPKVGKRHAAIHIVPGGFELEDLPLGAETLVNGKAAQRTRLKSGDRIQIGGTQLVFMEKAQAAG